MDWPVNHLVPLLCTCSWPGCSVAFMREPGLRALLFLECRWGLARAMVQWNGKHAIPCSAWCQVTVRGCVMFFGYWLNDLGLNDKSLNPCRLSACWQRNVSSTCLHIDPRTLLDWRVHIPKISPPEPRNNLSTTSPVSHALLAMDVTAIETIQWTCVFSPDIAMDYLSVAVNLFSFRYTDGMAVNSALCVAYYSLSLRVKKSRHRVSTGH